jgi:hypothetical protein
MLLVDSHQGLSEKPSLVVGLVAIPLIFVKTLLSHSSIKLPIKLEWSKRG